MEHLTREEREHYTYCFGALVGAAIGALLYGIDTVSIFIAMFVSTFYILLSTPGDWETK